MKTAVAAALLATTAAAPVAASSYIDSTSTFYTGGATTLVNATGFDFKPLHFGQSVSAGKIYGSSYFGHYGAKVTASVAAKLELAGSLSFQNTIGQVQSGQVETFAGNPFGPLTSSFVLGTNFKNNSSLTFGGGGQVDASLTAAAYAGANISGKACVVECISGTIANLGIGNPETYNILGYHSATNSVTFLNKDYNNVLPQEFYSDTLPISAKLQAIDVSGKGTGTTTSGYTTTQTIAGAYIDVAKAIVDSFGLPNDVLSGSVLGFDYTTVAAKVGAGINAEYTVASSLFTEYIDYRFSSKVQVYNQQTGTWSKPTSDALIDDGDIAIVRPVSQVASLSILPTVVTGVNVNTTLRLYAEAEDHIKLLEVSGHGIDAGPLYEQNGSVDLGTIAQFSKIGAIFGNTALSAMTLNFGNGSTALAAPLSEVGGLSAFAAADDGPAAFSGDRGFVFVPDDPAATGNTIAGKIYLATNFGTRGCNGDSVALCTFDRSFTPIAEEQRTTRDATGAPEMSYAVDFDTVDRFTAAPEGAYGVQGTPETLRALLAALPGTDGYSLPADIAGNTTPFMQTVPEPAAWAMMVVGFGLVGGLARRRRGERTVAA